MKENTHYDVIVIGGGITGTGVARDCALRGLKVLLVEKSDFAAGATGRNHGLLHSGARYAVTDGESATECISENMILRKIAAHCVDETDGLFITLPEDDLAYQAKFIESCLASGIKAEAIDSREAIRMEPAVNPALIGAVRVPDGSVDPFRLTLANALDARCHGAEILTCHEVTGFMRKGNRIIGVSLFDSLQKQPKQVYADIVVNA
ncbi:MAG: FAD-dependent oxidoreductase, partial [Bacteroidales bacterium]